MAINCGIVGLPNVGKSTIFSALTSVAATAENYPFCTIEPNIGLVEVPDTRLEKIAELYNPQKTIPTVFEFVDIAGLVSGAAKGEGLGNKFLSHIRETGIIAHVIRCFDDSNISHVNGSVDPIRDIDIINTELALADLETVQKRMGRISTEKKVQDPKKKRDIEKLEPLLKEVEETLGEGKPVRTLDLDDDKKRLLHDLHLITIKPLLYVCNVKEEDIAKGNAYSKVVQEFASSENSECIQICGQLESEIALLPKEDRKMFLQDAGLTYSALDVLIRSAYHTLGLRTYFTAGEKEVRAWTFKAGCLAPQAAGIIHTDFEKGFIRAEAFSCNDLFEYGSEAQVRTMGKLRTEGKDYQVQDGDILHFRFNI